MAKGIEDTAFYRWHRQVGLNEVGGDPDLLDDASAELLHRWAVHQQQHWPLGMTTLSTHDTKRSEDVRARLVAVAGRRRVLAALLGGVRRRGPQARRRPADRAPRLADARRRRGDRRRAAQGLPRQGDARVQAAHVLARLRPGVRSPGAGRWPPTPTATAGSRRWSAPRSTTTPTAVRAMVLGQKLLQLTLPGVPDTYQGCELVDLSLVDPDNRRPVDYDDRRARLAHLRDGAPRDLDDEKLLVTHKALALRRELRDAFADTRRPPAAGRHVAAPRRVRPRGRGRGAGHPGRQAARGRRRLGAARRSRSPRACGATS